MPMENKNLAAYVCNLKFKKNLVPLPATVAHEINTFSSLLAEELIWKELDYHLLWIAIKESRGI